jgi:putative FmdB family regulatory protein
VKLPTLQ